MKTESKLQSWWNEPRRFFFAVLALSIIAIGLVYVLNTLQSDPAPTSVRSFGLMCLVAMIVTAVFSALLFVLAWIPPVRRCLAWVLQRRFFFLACIVTLVALFYALENWRGQNAWEKFRQSEEAKGEILDLTKIAPAPVPHEENFAAAEIWIKHIIAQMNIERATRWYGEKATALGTNFSAPLEIPRELPVLAMTNRSSGWAKGEKTDLAAWQAYYRELKELTNHFPVPAQPGSPSQDVLLALSRYENVIAQLKEASKRPYSRFPLNYVEDNPAAILMPHLATFKQLSQTLQLRACAALDAGKTDEALSDVLLLFRLLHATRDEPILITMLVRFAQFHIAVQPIWEGLVAHQWNPEQLTVLESELAKLNFLSDYAMTMRGERAFGLGIMDYMERNRQSMGEIFEAVDALEPGNVNGADGLFQAAFGEILPKGWYLQNKVSIARAHRELTFPIVDVQKHSISWETQERLKRFSERPRRSIDVYDLFTALLFPALQNMSVKTARAQAFLDMARIAVAIERHRLAHNEIPQALDTLVPDFLPALPPDVISGEPLKFFSEPIDGLYKMYSIGWNRTDDNGTVVLTRGKTPSISEREGDWVWKSSAN